MMSHEERIHAIAGLGFTERQAGFLVTVLVHAGVCVGRQYCTYARIVRGQIVHDFFNLLVARRYATRYTCGHNKARIYHLHHRALYRAVGEPHTRLRKSSSLPRAIERLMILDHVLASPESLWLASEREKVAHFMLNTALRQHELPSLTFGTGESKTVRHFPDRLPIGRGPDGRYIFVYLVTDPMPVDFRTFLGRHAELLRGLRTWTVRLLFPRHLFKARLRYEGAAVEELASPIRPAAIDQLRWYFQQGDATAVTDARRYRRADSAFGSARFRALHRAWKLRGDGVLEELASAVLADALERGDGRIESQALTRQYFHLTPLVGTS
jgi:hypothetical protein